MRNRWLIRVLIGGCSMLLPFAILPFTTGCGAATPGTSTNLSLAATPTFSPAAGTYTSVQSVTISDSTPGATVYYTTNGSTPTTTSTVYSSAINVSSSETLEAIAVASGYSQSATGSAAYTITTLPAAATPTFSPAAGTYTLAQSVTISDLTLGATVYYTTNGTTPTTTSTVYSSAINVSSSETLEAIAVASGYSQSATGSAAYTISTTKTTSYTYFTDSGGPTQEDAYIYDNYTTNPPGGFVAGTATSTPPFWYVNEGNWPQPFTSASSSFNSSPCTTDVWGYAGPEGIVCWNTDATIPGNYDAMLGVNNTAVDVACSTEQSETVGPDNYGTNPLAGGPALSAMSALSLGFAVDLNYYAVGSHCGTASDNPSADQDTIVASVVFSDSTSGQTLYYQVILNESDDAEAQFCSAGAPDWYEDPEASNSLVFGVNDYLSSAYSGQTCPPNADPDMTTYSLNILPRVTALIDSEPTANLDTNLADWTVSGVYYGVYVYGDAIVEAAFTNLSLVAEVTTQ